MPDQATYRLPGRFGIAAALAVVALEAAYLVVLTIGLARLPAPDVPIADPWFTAMELLILALSVPMVALTVALYTWAPPARKPFAALAVAFMTLTAGLTATVHFSILTLGRQPGFAEMPQVFAFAWPSVVYALDILAWDVFFAIAALSAAAAVPGPGLARAVRWLLLVSGVLAFAGLSGVALGDMAWRNIGIVGYVLVFPLAALGLARLFAGPR